MKQRIQFLLLSLTALACIGLIEYQLHKTVVPAHSTQYLQELKKQEQTIWQRLESNGISNQTFTQKKNDYLKKVGSHIGTHEVSASLKQLIIPIMQDFNIATNEISLKYSNDRCEACTDNNTIYINESLFKKLPKNAAKFVIGHEIQHLKFQDSVDRNILKEMANHLDPKISEPLLDDYMLFQETRADIYAALKNKEYAESYISFMDYVLQIEGDYKNSIYMSNSDRLKLAQNVYQNHLTTA